MIKILVTGANGQLGSDIRSLQNNFKAFNFTYTDIADVDITDIKQLDPYFKNSKFDFVINCAAYTAVDKAESETEKANQINGDAAGNIALFCKENNTKLIHISTDYIFDGTSHRPYVETERANPVSAYGKSKLIGEQKVIESGCDAIIIRTSWLYSSFGNNFVKTMIKYGTERGLLNVVFDQVGTPTYAAELADAILKIIEYSESTKDFKTGIYHYSNEGVCSWYDFAIEIIEKKNINCKINPIETKDYPTPARRPHYSVFNKSKIKEAFNIEIPHWKISLDKCLKKL
jgi:dTDP-4-dehydrorhamnose reductase